MLKKIVLLLAFLVVCSCSIHGLTNDYEKLNTIQKNSIVALTNFDSLKPATIYKITGLQLRTELKKHSKSIVYIFKNGCTSDLCKPLKVYENYAKKNGYTLFLVMNGYANLDETESQPYESTLFSINNEYYKSTYRNTYTRYFENELTNKPLNEKAKEYLGNLFFFENDSLIKVFHELP